MKNIPFRQLSKNRIGANEGLAGYNDEIPPTNDFLEPNITESRFATNPQRHAGKVTNALHALEGEVEPLCKKKLKDVIARRCGMATLEDLCWGDARVQRKHQPQCSRADSRG